MTQDDTQDDLNTLVNAAFHRTVDTGEPSPLFDHKILSVAAQVYTADYGAFVHARELIKKKVSARIAREWESIVTREVKERKKAYAKLDRSERAAANGEHAEVIEAEKLPKATTAKDFGLTSYRKEPTPANLANLYGLMNLEFAVVPVGNKVQIACFSQDNATPVFRSSDAVNMIFANVMVPNDAKHKPHQMITAFEGWLAWPGRKDYSGVGFYPGSDKYPPHRPKGFLNLWQGYQVKPAEGDWSLIETHFRQYVCGGNDAHATWLLDWLANMLQRPQSKCPTCLVIRSDQEGAGKSIIVSDLLKTIMGPAARNVSKQGQLTGRFNAQIEDTIALGVEEAVYAGSKADANVLKNLISDDMIEIERKGIDSYSVRNHTHLIFTSNEEWVVPAGLQARRFFVLDMKNPHANRAEYFVPLREQMRSAEGAGAFLHAMLNREITSDLTNPPKTEALREQQRLSLQPIEAWVLDIATRGTVVVRRRDEHAERQFALEKGLTIDTEDLRKSAEGAMTNPHQRNGLEHRLGVLLKAVGVHRKKAKDGVRWNYVFPSLEEFKLKVARRLGFPVTSYADEDAAQNAIPDDIKRILANLQRFKAAITPTHEAGHA